MVRSSAAKAKCNSPRTLAASVVLAVLLAALAAPASAQDFTSAQTSCNELATSPADGDLPEGAVTVEFAILDPAAAIEACEAALKDDPENPRILFQLGRSYDRSGDFDQAIAYYQEAIDRGYATAMRAMGLLHANGDGVARDDVAAADWLQKAIDAGSIASLVDLGWYYFSGIGVPQDNEKTVELFQQAADTGLGYGLVALAWLYETGSAGVGLDEAEAFTLYKQAADVGDNVGMYNLALIYRDGKFGYATDYKAAIRWFEQAADLGNAEAMVALSHLHAQALGVPRSETKAKEWLDKAAAIALPDSTYTIASNFEFGTDGAVIDYEQAARWYRMGADTGDVDSIWALGRLYYEEASLPNSDEAEALFEQAFEIGGGYYGYYTGSSYESHGDYAKALDWYQRSADAGDIASMVRAGTLLESGSVVDRDSAQAEVLFEKAAESNDPAVMLSIGYAYYYGDETGDSYVANLPKALEWMQRASAAGSEEAADVALDLEAEIADSTTATPEDDTTVTPDEDTTVTPGDTTTVNEDDTTPTTEIIGKDKDKGGDTGETTPVADEDDKGKDKG